MTTCTARVLIATFVLAAAACGGGGDEPPTYANALLDDEGHLVPNARTDVATGVPHATAAQAAALEHSLGQDAIRVDVEGEGAEAIKRAVQIVFGVQAAHDLPSNAPVLVHGGDVPSVRAVVQQLTAAGFSRIWIVDAVV